MGKEKVEKKEKKSKKEKHADTDGVSKKSKKDKPTKSVTLEQLNKTVADVSGVPLEKTGDVVVAEFPDEESGAVVRRVIPQDALVPFANPLADEKQTKKVLKGVKKAAKNRVVKRGVKEVVKSLRKTPSSGPASAAPSSPSAIVIIAADISPMDVISHLPVMCEEANIPYIYVTSRAELGAAGNTKRPTSVVMIMRERPPRRKEVEGKEKAEEEVEDWPEVFGDLVKLVQKAARVVKI